MSGSEVPSPTVPAADPTGLQSFAGLLRRMNSGFNRIAQGFAQAHPTAGLPFTRRGLGISEADIVELNIPTGEPLVYDLGDDLRPLADLPVDERYLRDAAEIRAAAEAVARQAEGR